MKPLHIFFTHKGASYRLVLHDQGIESLCFDTRSLPQDPDWCPLHLNDTAWQLVAEACAQVIGQLRHRSITPALGAAAGDYAAYTLGEIIEGA